MKDVNICAKIYKGAGRIREDLEQFHPLCNKTTAPTIAGETTFIIHKLKVDARIATGAIAEELRYPKINKAIFPRARRPVEGGNGIPV